MAGAPIRMIERITTSRATAASNAAAMMKKPGLMVAARWIRRSIVIADLPAGGVVVVLVPAHQPPERPAAQHGKTKGEEAEHAEEPRQAFDAAIGVAHYDDVERDQESAQAGQPRHEHAEEQHRPHPGEEQDRQRMLARL